MIYDIYYDINKIRYTSINYYDLGGVYPFRYCNVFDLHYNNLHYHKEIQYRRIKDIDLAQFRKDIEESALYFSQTKDNNEYAELYNITFF